jgi:hypothetical protein
MKLITWSYSTFSMLVLVYVLACFTSPSAFNWAIWIDTAQIVAVEHPMACVEGAGAQIVTSAGTVCVMETPKQILSVLGKLKKDDK